MRTALVLLAAVALAACRGYPPHQASVERHFEVPAAGLEGLTCETHNGGIRVRGGEVDRVVVRATLRARGWSPEEAAANVQRIRLVNEVDDGWLRLCWKDEELREWDDAAPDVAFVIDAPAGLAGSLSTHNGDVEIHDLEGDVRAVTHNGRVVIRGASPKLAVETHNGSVDVELSGSGPVAGRLLTHNGGVRLDLGGRSARIAARTHHGGISVRRGAGIARSDGGELTVSVGEGGGDLEIVTHNGEVVVR